MKSPSIGPFDKNKSIYFCFDSTICTRAKASNTRFAAVRPEANLALLASGEPPTCRSLQNKPLLFDHSDGSCLIVVDSRFVF